jgi:peroxin-7
MATFQSPGFAHYSIAWSPFLNNTLAVAASANYGLIGNGRLNILSVDPSLASGPVLQRQYVAALGNRRKKKNSINKRTNVRFDTQDGLFDLAWSELHQNQIVTGSGDGSLKLWDITLNVRLHLLRFSLRLTRQKLGFSNPSVAGTHEGSV